MDLDLDSRIRTIALGGVLLVVVIAAVVWFFVLGGDEGGEPPPESWDPGVTAYVDFIQVERGLPFVNPVAVDLVDDDEFAAVVGAGADGPSEADLVHIQQAIDLMRAMALVTENVDDEALAQQVATRVLVDDQLARYLAGERRIVVRADSLDDLDPIVEAELVGALGAAFHHQHFGVAAPSLLDRSTSVVGRRALSAGVSNALSERFVADWSEREQQAWADHVDPGRDDDADAVVAHFITVTEDLGEALVDVALADTVTDGSAPTWGQVNQLLAAPPRTELELIQPWAALDGFERALVSPPVVDDDQEVIAQGDFGAASLYVALGIRVDPREVLAASLEWSGDAYVLTRDADGRRCIAIAVEGSDGDASDLYQDAMEDWVSAAPSGADASVERDGRTVTLRSCDPERSEPADLVLDPATAISVAVNRTELLAQLRNDGSSRNSAVCTANRVLAAIPVAAIVDPDPPPEAQTLYNELLEESIVVCRNL